RQSLHGNMVWSRTPASACWTWAAGRPAWPRISGPRAAGCTRWTSTRMSSKRWRQSTLTA
ncbi:ECE2, partial [Symbiodinium microadriaticum]